MGTDAPTEAPVSRFASIAAGLILGAIALGMAALVVAFVFRALQGSQPISTTELVMTGVLTALALGLGRVAWRLVAAEPNKFGSLFSPFALKAFAVFWLLCALAMVYFMIEGKTREPLGAIVGMLVLAGGSWRYAGKLRGPESHEPP